MKRLLMFVAAVMLFGAANVKAQQYEVAPAGTKDFTTLVNVVPSGTVSLDIYLTGVVGAQNAGGVYLDFTGSTADIAYVSAGRAMAGGSEGVFGPWMDGAGGIVDEPDGAGTLVIVVGNLGGAFPDGDGDLIVGRVTLQNTGSNDADVQFSVIPGFTTWAPLDDAFVTNGSVTIQQEGAANVQFGWEQVVGDGAGAGNGFGDANNENTVSMSVFGGYLYVGTGNITDGCQVWRSGNGTTWNQVNTDGFGDANNHGASSMAVFGSYLYVGTGNITDGCEVWRSSDGTTWNQVVGDESGMIGNGFGDADNFIALSMAVFGSYLYVGNTYGEVWRSSDGITWNQVNTDGFGDANNHGASSMAVFGSYLYVGTDNTTDGCEVWRSSDGTTWDQVVGDESGMIGNGFGDADNFIALSMAVFGSSLYVGTHNLAGCEVWHSSDGTTWNQVVGGMYGGGNGFGDADNADVFSMAVFDSYLYVGISNTTDGCEVRRSNDGTTWNQINTDGFMGADNHTLDSTAVFGSYLYVGTGKNIDGCEVWRLPQDSDDDGIADNEDKCPCHPNGINKGTCVNNVGSVIMSYEEGDELITCDDDSDCAPTGGYCQTVQGDYNWNGIGDVCEGYADFNESGDVNLIDLLDLILCYGKTNFITYPLCEQYDINNDNRVSAWDYLILTLQYSMDGFDTCGVGIAPARVAKTGQNSCYDELGVEINCLDTGQDGEYQKGVIGPSPRFTNNGDGTVTDNLTGLMWTQDTQQVSGTMTWSDALTECNDLDYAGHDDWRLPNASGLWSLIDFGEDTPALPQGHPFSNVLSDYYWASTTYAMNNSYAFLVYMSYGYSWYGDKDLSPSYAWCVRGKTNGPAPIPKTGQTFSYATGDDGNLQMGTTWPNPRFTDNGDGTITDNLTRLVWLKDANCIATNYPGFDNDGTYGDGYVSWQHAVDFVEGINDETYPLCGAGKTDWRLPNVRELHSLIHHGFYGPATPNTVGTGKGTEGDPFTNQESTYHWSSTTYAYDSGSAWYAYFHDGHVSSSPSKSIELHVRAVRSGQ